MSFILVKDDDFYYILVNKTNDFMFDMFIYHFLLTFLILKQLLKRSKMVNIQKVSQLKAMHLMQYYKTRMISRFTCKNVKTSTFIVCVSVCLSIHVHTHAYSLFPLWAAVTNYLFLAVSTAHRVAAFQQLLLALRSFFLEHILHLFLFCWPCHNPNHHIESLLLNTTNAVMLASLVS